MRIPERLTWTIDRLGIAGNETMLEIGGGRGIAAALVLSKLTTGRLVGIDRSAVATEAARTLNAVDEHTGRLQLVQAAIESFEAGADRFDIVFAINVNLFWIDAATALTAIRGLLKPDGRLVLAYEPPSAGQIESISGKLQNNLEATGWQVAVVDKAQHAPFLAIEARPC